MASTMAQGLFLSALSVSSQSCVDLHGTATENKSQGCERIYNCS